VYFSEPKRDVRTNGSQRGGGWTEGIHASLGSSAESKWRGVTTRKMTYKITSTLAMGLRVEAVEREMYERRLGRWQKVLEKGKIVLKTGKLRRSGSEKNVRRSVIPAIDWEGDQERGKRLARKSRGLSSPYIFLAQLGGISYKKQKRGKSAARIDQEKNDRGGNFS